MNADDGVGWFDMEVSPPPRVPGRPQELFPANNVNDDHGDASTAAAAAGRHYHSNPPQPQFVLPPQQFLLPQQSSQPVQEEMEYSTQLQQAESTTTTTHLQEYLHNLVERVQGRSHHHANENGGGPLQGQELEELKLQASRDGAAFGSVDTSVLTTVAQWLYEHVLHASSVSLLDEAGRCFASNVAPSQAMAAFQTVCYFYEFFGLSAGPCGSFFCFRATTDSHASLRFTSRLIYTIVVQIQGRGTRRNFATRLGSSEHLVAFGDLSERRSTCGTRRCLAFDGVALSSALDATHYSVVESNGTHA